MPDGPPRPSDSLVAFERDRLTRDLHASIARRDALTATVEEMAAELALLRQRADEAEASLAAVTAEVELAGARPDDADREATLHRLARQRRELLADVLDAQARLTERTEQLVELRCGRWHRAASLVWGLRGRIRRHAGLVACGLLASCGGFVAGIYEVVPTGALPVLVIVGLSALAAAALVLRREWRRQARSQQRWVERLRARDARVLELHAGEEEPAPPIPTASVAAPSAPPQVKVERRLVPAIASGAADEVLADGPVDPQRLRVAAILDEISEACFAPECDLEALTPGDWRGQLEAHEPHLLLVESAWNGSGGGWAGAIASQPSGPPRQPVALGELVSAFRERGIPTVFWNKEDPVHHERFVDAAALFDHVLSTDADSVERYAALEGERTAGVLPFAAQPRLHNPIAASDRVPRAAFAGAYYRDRPEARRAELELLLDAARPFGLDIYDRTLGSDSDAYGFPERFSEHVRGRLAYAEIGEAYRRYALFLNVNSATESPTMCARRVFELLACGTPVVSTPSRAFDELLAGRVAVVDSLEQATAQIDRLLNDTSHRRLVAMQGRREVLARHTYAHRFAEILRVAGFRAPDPSPRASALLLVDSTADAALTLTAIGAAAEHAVELLVGLPIDAALDGPLDALAAAAPQLPVRLVHQADDLDERERLRELAALARAPWVAPLRAGTSFHSEDLRELLACTTYAQAEVIGGTDPRGVPQAREQTFVADLDATFTVAARDDVAAIGWPGSEGLAGWARRGKRLYRADTVSVEGGRALHVARSRLRPPLRRRVRRSG